MITENNIKKKSSTKKQKAKLTSFFGGSFPPHFGDGSFAPNKDLIRLPFIMLTHLHRNLLSFFFAQIITKMPFSPQTKAICLVCSCAVIFCQGQVKEWGRLLTFKETKNTLVLSHLFNTSSRLLTNASVLLCSCRLVSASLMEAACCSATICAWALDAAAAAVFNASWLTANSPSSRRHSAWLCRRCSPVCEKSILKQGSLGFSDLLCRLFWRSGQCQLLDTFLSLAGIPA